MTIINEIQRRILLYISYYGIRPDYIILGKKEWGLYIRFFGHNNSVTIEEGGALFFDEIPVIRVFLDHFCEAAGGTEKIKIQMIEEN